MKLKFALASLPSRRTSQPRNCLTLVSFLLILAVCAASFPSCGTRSRALEIPTLLAEASKYNGQIVTLHGCYQNGLEKQIIRACVNPKPSESIWVVPYTEVENSEKSIPGYRARSTKTDPPTLLEQDLYAKLAATPNGVLSEVVVRGEFQYSSAHVYGISPGYDYQLILYRVLNTNRR
jgi:hypothetical protein